MILLYHRKGKEQDDPLCSPQGCWLGCHTEEADLLGTAGKYTRT